MFLVQEIIARTKIASIHKSPNIAPSPLNGLADPPLPRYPIKSNLAKQNPNPIPAEASGNPIPATKMKINIGAIYSTKF
jgi:hypothetical protein